MSGSPPARPRRNSSNDFSTKQIARAVLDGRRVTLEPPAEPPVSGYIFGGDDFHWGILQVVPETLRLRKRLIHKSGTHIELHEESTLSSEPMHDEIEKIVAPYRSRLASENLGPQERSRS